MLVWIHMLPGDGAEVAAAQANALPTGSVAHFYDPRRRSGKALSSVVGAGRSVVWDTYLWFAPGVEWGQAPPAPEDWAHQLDAAWADPDRFRWDDELTAWLRQAAGHGPAAHQP